GRGSEGEIVGFQVTHRRALAPAHEQQRRTVAAPPSLAGRSVGKSVDGIRLAVGGSERGRASMDLLITAQRRVVHQGGERRCRDSLRMLVVMNAMFAGRSASRRIRYGYQCVPNGT